MLALSISSSNGYIISGWKVNSNNMLFIAKLSKTSNGVSKHVFKTEGSNATKTISFHFYFKHM